MKNLERLFLILDDNKNKAEGEQVARRLFGLKPFIFIVTFITYILYNVSAFADTCRDCHTNPKYKKEDIVRLKECLACHGSAGHPYKQKSGIAEAAEIQTPQSPMTASQSNAPDLKGMILVPEGEFVMGTDDRLRDEKPEHVVYIKAFYIDKFEVTHEDYKKFTDSTGYPAPNNWEDNNYPVGKGKHPVIYVSWSEAKAYCSWSGKRLPREVEWEKAARGTDARIYPWGNKWDLNKSNNPLRGHEGTMPVGSFENGKSPYGLYDMSGNVWEWVDDHYLPHPGSDYVSPEFGKKYRLLKGGSWWDCMFYGCGISAPTFNRSFFDASTKNDSFGFRCAADAK